MHVGDSGSRLNPIMLYAMDPLCFLRHLAEGAENSKRGPLIKKKKKLIHNGQSTYLWSHVQFKI